MGDYSCFGFHELEAYRVESIKATIDKLIPVVHGCRDFLFPDHIRLAMQYAIICVIHTIAIWLIGKQCRHYNFSVYYILNALLSPESPHKNYAHQKGECLAPGNLRPCG